MTDEQIYAIAEDIRKKEDIGRKLGMLQGYLDKHDHPLEEFDELEPFIEKALGGKFGTEVADRVQEMVADSLERKPYDEKRKTNAQGFVGMQVCGRWIGKFDGRIGKIIKTAISRVISRDVEPEETPFGKFMVDLFMKHADYREFNGILRDVLETGDPHSRFFIRRILEEAFHRLEPHEPILCRPSEQYFIMALRGELGAIVKQEVLLVIDSAIYRMSGRALEFVGDALADEYGSEVRKAVSKPAFSFFNKIAVPREAYYARFEPVIANALNKGSEGVQEVFEVWAREIEKQSWVEPEVQNRLERLEWKVGKIVFTAAKKAIADACCRNMCGGDFSNAQEQEMREKYRALRRELAAGLKKEMKGQLAMRVRDLVGRVPQRKER